MPVDLDGLSNRLKDDNIWEAVQILNGDIFIYRGGFLEEAYPHDVFKFNAGLASTGQTVYQFSRFDFNPAEPAQDSMIRLNRAVIVFAWYINPKSDVIQKLKRAIPEMNAKKAGLVLPVSQG